MPRPEETDLSRVSWASYATPVSAFDLRNDNGQTFYAYWGDDQKLHSTRVLHMSKDTLKAIEKREAAKATEQKKAEAEADKKS